RTDKYEGTPEQWNEAQAIMGELLDTYLGKDNYKIGIDEAAFYGPKLDIQCKNVFGKEDTIVTIQIDMLLAKKFGMEYIDSDNTAKTPYIIHRTSLGCYERTLALLIEKYAGALPTWLSPVQVRLLPITDRNNEYTDKVMEALERAGVKCEVDKRQEKTGYKVREAQLKKIPYMLVIGDKEQEEGTVSVRRRDTQAMTSMKLDEFIAMIVEEINTKKR
ncbi:MAG: threonine--tRNA ligase, partial [Clostridia bacterium]|nr:threonine--tRNA ligase [Clostridia bacterium]